MQIVVFEDEQVADLAPITLRRPAFAISCGSRRLVDLLARLGCPVHAVVRPHLRRSLRPTFRNWPPSAMIPRPSPPGRRCGSTRGSFRRWQPAGNCDR